MSIRGLYDSEIGDKLARKALTPFYKAVPAPKDGRRRRSCACGEKLARPYIVRSGVKVCKQCAAKSLKLQGGNVSSYKCVKCENTFPRLSLVMRKGKLFCKQCVTEL